MLYEVITERLEADFQKGTPLLESMTVRDRAVMTRLRGSQTSDDELRAHEIRMRFRNSEDKTFLEALDAEGSVRWISSQPASEDGNTDPIRRSRNNFV